MSGLGNRTEDDVVINISISKNKDLVKLANCIDWASLASICLVDLKKTTKGCWWLGRALMLRIHLAVYILQNLYKETDRGMENRLQTDALWQVFCGIKLVTKWSIPDHTKIEEFRSRLSPSTHHSLGESILKSIKDAGFTDSKWMDIDSTVQEANMSYPSDASLMVKCVEKAFKVAEVIKKHGTKISVNVKEVKEKSKEYFFLSRNTIIEKKRKIFKELHELTCKQVVPVIKTILKISQQEFNALPSRTKLLFTQVCEVGSELLVDIETFIKTQKMVPTKPLSFHLKAVTGIIKGKLGKKIEFGRVFQLGRLPGNFLLIAKSRSLRESDKSAAGQLMYYHGRVFGTGKLESLGADKGYYSEKNIKTLKRARVKTIGVQMPSNIKAPLVTYSDREWEILKNRRAGIEPLIGHAKGCGLRRSRMKTDVTTESAAYRSVMGFNLRQLLGCLEVPSKHKILNC